MYINPLCSPVYVLRWISITSKICHNLFAILTGATSSATCSSRTTTRPTWKPLRIFCSLTWTCVRASLRINNWGTFSSRWRPTLRSMMSRVLWIWDFCMTCLWREREEMREGRERRMSCEVSSLCENLIGPVSRMFNFLSKTGCNFFFEISVVLHQYFLLGCELNGWCLFKICFICVVSYFFIYLNSLVNQKRQSKDEITASGNVYHSTHKWYMPQIIKKIIVLYPIS